MVAVRKFVNRMICYHLRCGVYAKNGVSPIFGVKDGGIWGQRELCLVGDLAVGIHITFQ